MRTSSGICGCNKIYEKWFYTLRNLMNYLDSSPLFPTLLILFELESSSPFCKFIQVNNFSVVWRSSRHFVIKDKAVWHLKLNCARTLLRTTSWSAITFELRYSYLLRVQHLTFSFPHASLFCHIA